jgi:hypothetical protein
VNYLTLKIGQINVIAIANGQFADPARSEIHRDGRTQASRAYYQYVGSDQGFLPFYTNLR